MEPQLRLEEATRYLSRGNFTIADIEVPGVGADQLIRSHTLQATTFSLRGSRPLDFFSSRCPEATQKPRLPHGCELRAICRVLDDNRYYPLCSEKEVVPYIEGVTADADQGTINFLRGMVTSRMT